jgi:hypothetical protein
MPKKAIHPARKAFRHVLFFCLCASLGFFIAVVALRITYRNDRPIEGPLQAHIFHLDVLKHRTWTIVSDDAEDMRIAEQLLRMGIFSPIYSNAGLDILEAKAENGYQPAVDRLAIIAPKPIAPVQDE